MEENVITRIVNSKKAIYAVIPVVANVIVSVFGYDPTSTVILVLDAAFAALLFFQGVIDVRFGSQSDGTKTL